MPKKAMPPPLEASSGDGDKSVPGHSLSRGAAILAGGATIANVLAIVAELFSSRLFPPEVFGTAAAFAALAMTFGMVACLRYEAAIILADDHAGAVNALALVLVILIAFSLGLGAMTWAWGDRMLPLIGLKALAGTAWLLLPLAVFFIGLEIVLRQWVVRFGRLGQASTARVLVALPRAAAELVGGVAGFASASHLVLYRLIGQVAGPGYLALVTLQGRDFRGLRKTLSPRAMLAAAQRYAEFPKYDVWSMLFQLSGWHAPVILLAAIYSPQVGGLYAKAVYLLYLPVLLISEAYNQVLLQHAAPRLARGESIASLVTETLGLLLAVGTLPFALLMVAGQDIFRVMLGAPWTDAGLYAAVLAPWLLLVFIHAAIISLFGALGRQRFGLYSNALRSVLSLGALATCGALFEEPLAAVAASSLVNTLLTAWRIRYILHAAGAAFGDLVSGLAQSLMWAFPAIAIVATAKYLLGAGPLTVLGVAAVCATPYVIVFMKQQSRLGLLGRP